MGILDVFKKKQKKERTLDLPPPPLPEAPEGEDFHLPGLPEEASLPKEEELAPPPMELPEEPFAPDAGLEFPEIPEHKEPIAPIPTQSEHEIPPIFVRDEREEMLPRYNAPFSESEHEQVSIPQPRMIPSPAEMPRPEPIVRQEPISQLFVSMDDYQAILSRLSETRRTLQNSAQIVDDLNKIKNQEDKVFEDWRVQVEDIERKLSYIDQAISKGENA